MENTLLDYLYELTQKEQLGELNAHEVKGYTLIVDFCQVNCIVIDFGITI